MDENATPMGGDQSDAPMTPPMAEPTPDATPAEGGDSLGA